MSGGLGYASLSTLKTNSRQETFILSGDHLKKSLYWMKYWNSWCIGDVYYNSRIQVSLKYITIIWFHERSILKAILLLSTCKTYWITDTAFYQIHSMLRKENSSERTYDKVFNWMNYLFCSVESFYCVAPVHFTMHVLSLTLTLSACDKDIKPCAFKCISLTC